ncbi:hypothetical protein ACFPIJ_30260 [Dactylosporangium cerinum]|uniref:Uncharacterized protein n=1 Tax=Dactylosporangium cerinum TaxID=1434730 RepID=A0ABV9W491_9ACTN
MSFSAFANHVRDAALPHQRRVSALRSCVQLYRPIGFHASLSFLAVLAGPYHRDETALLRALDALTASRAAWHVEVDRYAAERRAAKRLGQRSPRPGSPDPSHAPLRWYGDARRAALHALRRGPRRRSWTRDALAGDVDTCVAACLASDGVLTPAQRERLAAVAQAVGDRLRAWPAHDDLGGLHQLQDLRRLVRLAETAADAPAAPDVPGGAGHRSGV